MNLSEGILKSVESAFMQTYHPPKLKYNKSFVIKYNGELFCVRSKPKRFLSRTKAKRFLINFIYTIFWQGEYYMILKEKTKERTGYDVDFSATIEMLPQYGLTSRFDDPQNIKKFKNIAEKLIEEGIITIEEVTQIY
jgi:hypothetical protein